MCHLGLGHTNTFEFWPVISVLGSICCKEKLAIPRQRANGCGKGSITFLQGCVGYLSPRDLSWTQVHLCIAEQIQEVVYTHIYIDIDGCVTIIKEESLCREAWSNVSNWEGWGSEWHRVFMYEVRTKIKTCWDNMKCGSEQLGILEKSGHPCNDPWANNLWRWRCHWEFEWRWNGQYHKPFSESKSRMMF